MSLPKELYCDGGVIWSNPSNYGMTWAYRVMMDDGSTLDGSGLEERDDATNNQAEMMAMICGLVRCLTLDPLFSGFVYSDSMITINRMFHGESLTNLPDELAREAVGLRDLIRKNKIRYRHCKGHPTKKELAAGFSKKGRLVSEHQAWCDGECGRLSKEYLASLAHTGPRIIPSATQPA